MPGGEGIVGVTQVYSCFFDLNRKPNRGGFHEIASDHRPSLASRKTGTLYICVTSNLARRGHEHRSGVVAGFTRRYGVKRLVHVETFDDVRRAIQREKNLKHWLRAGKLALIEKDNPNWDDLYERIHL